MLKVIVTLEKKVISGGVQVVPVEVASLWEKSNIQNNKKRYTGASTYIRTLMIVRIILKSISCRDTKLLLQFSKY